MHLLSDGYRGVLAALRTLGYWLATRNQFAMEAEYAGLLLTTCRLQWHCASM